MLFFLILAVTFPTDQIVRAVIAGMAPAAASRVTFRTARLRPWGLIVDDLVVREVDGTVMARLASLRVKPSWLAMLHDRLGRPWHVGLAVCDGSVESRLDTDGRTHEVDATWENLDLGTCLPMLRVPLVLSGHISGHGRIHSSVSGFGNGEGELTLRDAVWKPPPVKGLEEMVLHADTAALRWRLADRTLALDQLEIRGRELDADVNGELRMSPRPGATQLKFHVRIAPLEDAPPQMVKLFAGLPRDEDGVYDFMLTGTLDAPRIKAN